MTTPGLDVVRDWSLDGSYEVAAAPVEERDVAVAMPAAVDPRSAALADMSLSHHRVWLRRCHGRLVVKIAAGVAPTRRSLPEHRAMRCCRALSILGVAALVVGLPRRERRHARPRGLLGGGRHALGFLRGVDHTKGTWDAWGNSMWPSVYLIDKRGSLRHFWPGELKWRGATGDAWMQDRIEELLAEPAAADADR
jgi:hypothetical protein